MIEKVMVFFSTYNIVVGLIITILSIFSVEMIRSLGNDVLIPLCHSTIDSKIIKINNNNINIGLFISSILRLVIAAIIIFLIIHIHPFEIQK